MPSYFKNLCFGAYSFMSILFVGIFPQRVLSRETNTCLNPKFLVIKDSIPGRCSPIKKPILSVCEKGFSFGYGYGIDGNNLPEGSYTPIFIIRKIGYRFPRITRKLPRNFEFSLILEPQANVILLRNQRFTKLYFEIGIGVGLENRFIISPSLSAFTHVIIGPSYFSTHTIRQSYGFIFSDNAGLGLTYSMGNQWAIQGEWRIRHLSNANLNMPNQGVNTNNFLVGISRLIP